MAHNKVDESSIPEVVTLNQTKSRIEEFRKANPKFFEYWDQLVDEYNERLSAADKAIRAKGVSCGDFELYQYATTYDAEYLYERFGREKFLELGGKIETVQQRSVDKKRIDFNISAGNISKEDAEQIKKVSPRYKAPKPLGRL